MNIYDKNSKHIATLSIHNASKNIIYNEGHGNILYKFENYYDLLAYIENKININTKNKVLKHILINSKEVKIIHESKNKKTNNNNNNQLSLF